MTTLNPGARVLAPAPLYGPFLPRRGEPGWSAWPRRSWPVDPSAAAPGRFLGAAVVAALAGTAVWRPSVLSVGYLAAGAIVFGVVYGTSGRRPTRTAAVGVALTLALLAVPGVFAAVWLGVLCIMAAWVTGWCTFVGGRTWTAISTAPLLPWVLPARVAGWVRRGVRSPRRRNGAPDVGRIALVAALSAAVLIVFGALFAGADAAFAHVLGSFAPTLQVDEAIARTGVFGIVAAFILAGGYLVRFPPTLDALAPAPATPVRRWEWAVPLGVLDALFLAFVAVQATVLFGGHTHVLETQGLTYAEYARQGFWQLLGVSALTLLVLAVVVRVAARTTGSDRRTLRVLVGILCAASIVVVVSAIHRMWLYQEAYGFSVLRLLVITVEIWLGSVFLLVAVAGIRMDGRWLPRAVLVAGVLALLGLAALNPERLIAERNIDRFEQTGDLDAGYLSSLSSDIDPALSRLPDEVRRCVMREDPTPRAWYLFNLSRARSDRPVDADFPEGCDDYYWEWD
ncbi:DUF4153 domain-containing protein [Mycobacterium sp. WMMD1722]|uniref:DUF4153 domain-containing protein n=1 Tax=Mycobacterium sp. WMMD1722 TaxID=3404117 RepID=UPI003BF57B9B